MAFIWHSPEKSLDASLSDLGIDYVDLFLQHWPICLKGGPDGTPSETMADDENNVAIATPLQGPSFIDVYNAIEDIKANTGGEISWRVKLLNYQT